MIFTEKSHTGDISETLKALIHKDAKSEGFFKARPSFAKPNYASVMLQNDVQQKAE